MQGSVSVVIQAPRMLIDTITRKLHRTHEEPMALTATAQDGTVWSFPVTIPPTDVKRHSPLHWVVDQCEGAGGANGVAFVVELPPEDVTWDWRLATMVARRIDCRATLRLPGGQAAVGIVTFPDCPTHLFPPPVYAEACTATGVLVFQ